MTTLDSLNGIKVEEVVELMIWKIISFQSDPPNDELNEKWSFIKKHNLFNISACEIEVAKYLKTAFLSTLGKHPKHTDVQNAEYISLDTDILDVLNDRQNHSLALEGLCTWFKLIQINSLKKILKEKIVKINDESSMQEISKDEIKQDENVNQVANLSSENQPDPVQENETNTNQEPSVDGKSANMENKAEQDLNSESKPEPEPESESESEPEQEPQPEPEPEPEPINAAAVIKSMWNNLPIEDGPDKHDEFSDKFVEENGFQFIAARARGKKHKHEGTNCDDWYEFGTAGNWHIIAVSDGAGSKKYSRVGSRVACESAVRHLTKSLSNHTIAKAENFSRDPVTFKFVQEDLEYVQLALHDAMRYARDEVENAALLRSKSDNHEKYIEKLGRELQFNDLSATLLVAVHCLIPYQGQNYSFVLTCQIGDGMLAAVHHDNKLELLGVPDSGEFSGETDFITSSRTVGKQYLSVKTRGTFGKIKLLMVMTDGISDDYYPNDPGLLHLYNDLIEQGILPTQQLAENVKSQVDIAFEKLGEPERTLSEKLLHMIDTYQLRGSFDDRTIVLLNKGE